MLPIQGAQVQSLIRQLGSHMPHGAAYSQEKKQLFRHFHSKIKLQKQLHLLLFLISFPSPFTQIRPSNPPLNTPFLMTTSCLGLLWFWKNSHIPWWQENPLILTKRGKQSKELCWVWILGKVTCKGSCWLVCVSDSPRILEAAVIPPLKSTDWVHLQRPGSWVTSSWGCISRSLIEKMTGLAWHGECKYLEWFRNQ